MADIELVIKIDEEFYNDIKSLGFTTYPEDIIKNGKPLPKRHGRLIDADALQKEILSWGMNDYEPSDFIDEINNADTIIEADKEYEVEIITRGNCMMCGKELTEGLFFCKECEENGESENKK